MTCRKIAVLFHTKLCFMIKNYIHFSSNNIHVFHKGSAKISVPAAIV